MTAKRSDESDDLVNIHFKLPKPLLEDVDRRARANLVSRSDYIRLVLVEKMGRQNMIDPPDPDWNPDDDEQNKLIAIINGL